MAARRLTKKAIEWHYLEGFRTASGALPAGEIEASESPDFVLPATDLGIELQRLFRPAHPQRGLLREQESLTHMIMSAAQAVYEMRGLPLVDVHVLFHRPRLRKSDVARYAAGIAELVAGLVPLAPDGHAELNGDDDHHALEAFPGVARIHIMRHRVLESNFFAPAMAAFRPTMGIEFVQAAIDAKNAKLPNYRRCRAFWLILAHGLEGLPSSMGFTEEVQRHAFRSGFARVFLFGWPSDVCELNLVLNPASV